MQVDHIGKYEKTIFPRQRNLVIDVVSLSRAKHHMPILLELDVSRAREYIRRYKQQTGKQISFTGWVLKCIAMAVSEHPGVHALRSGKHSMVLFQDIDILVTIQKQTVEGEIPLPYVVRMANKKNIYEINDEIRAAQVQTVKSQDMLIGNNPRYSNIYLRLPAFIRHIFGKMLLNDPFGIKRSTGTVGLSSIGMMGNFSGWAIPVGPLPLQFGIGSITKKPWIYQDSIQVREVLNMAFVFDHDTVDGTPVARFVSRLTELLQGEEGFAG